MKYSPKRPTINHNVTTSHPLKDFAVLIAGIFAGLMAVVFVLGLLVDFAVKYISPEQEQRWFNNAHVSALIKRSLSQSQSLQPLTIKNFEALKQCAGVTVPITVYVEPSPVVNAVALPGGVIIVYQGLIDQLQSKNGLSFVLAHELAHFKNRDHLQALGRRFLSQAVLGLIGGSTSTLDVVNFLAGVEQAHYSRTTESQADAAALNTLNCHYGHVGGATELFDAQLSQGANNVFNSASHYFASHPEARKRIDDILLRAKNSGFYFDDVVSF